MFRQLERVSRFNDLKSADPTGPKPRSVAAKIMWSMMIAASTMPYPSPSLRVQALFRSTHTAMMTGALMNQSRLYAGLSFSFEAASRRTITVHG